MRTLQEQRDFRVQGSKCVLGVLRSKRRIAYRREKTRTPTMKAIYALSFLVAASEATSFGRQPAVFGVHRGGERSRASLDYLEEKKHHEEEVAPKKPIDPDEEYERAQKAILSAVTTVEDHAQRLIAAEVDTFFHDRNQHKEQKKVAAKAKKAVEEGSRKVKQSVSAQKETHVYPFENHPYPYGYSRTATSEKGHSDQPPSHKDHRILKAIEAAEHAVLEAIEGEVDTLFHEADHHHKTTVQSGLQKTSEKVKDQHEDRRSWLSKFSENEIEAYTQQAMFSLE